MAEKTLEQYSPEEVQQMAATYQTLLNNPQTRDMALRLTKHVNPALSIPEIELKDATAAALKSRDEKIAELEAKQLAQEARDRIDRERRALRDEGFSADEITAVEKVMTDEHIPSYATAATYFRNARQVAQPTPATGEAQSTTYDLPAEALASMKAGKQGLKKFALQQAEAAMSEIQSGRIKLH